MPLESIGPIDTRGLFRPLSTSLVALLRALPDDAWERPTIAGTWMVRDVVAHLLDTTLRRLSFHRDRMSPPPPPHPITSERVRGLHQRAQRGVGQRRRTFEPAGPD